MFLTIYENFSKNASLNHFRYCVIFANAVYSHYETVRKRYKVNFMTMTTYFCTAKVLTTPEGDRVIVIILSLILMTFLLSLTMGVSKAITAPPRLAYKARITKTGDISSRASATVHNGHPQTMKLTAKCANGKTYIYYINPNRTCKVSFPKLATTHSSMELEGFLPKAGEDEWYCTKTFYTTNEVNCVSQFCYDYIP